LFILLTRRTAAERDMVDVYEIEIVQNMPISIEQLSDYEKYPTTGDYQSVTQTERNTR